MKNNRKLLSVLMALVLMLSLIPAAFAAKNDTEADTETTENEETTATAEEKEETSPNAEETAEPAEEETEEAATTEEIVETVTVKADETYYNDGGTVYNNGGTVYNNGGVVYNNGGITYNNLGTVYNNGGTAYNNGGTVYENSGDVYNNAGNIIEAGKAGFTKVSFTEDISKYVDVEGPEEDEKGVLWQPQEEALTLTAREGYVITAVETEEADADLSEDGVCTLTNFTASATEITVKVCAAAPEISLKTGTYAEKQTAKISTADGMSVYYTVDGTDPSAENGKLYSSAISVTEGMVLKAVAVQEGVGDSEIAAETYGFVTVTGPEFEKAEEGYETPEAGAVTVENGGETNAVIESVKFKEDTEYFTLSTEDGAAVMAGTTDTTTWTIQPAEGLTKGKYTATVVVTLDGGAAVEFNVTFTVKEAAAAETTTSTATAAPTATPTATPAATAAGTAGTKA